MEFACTEKYYDNFKTFIFKMFNLFYMMYLFSIDKIKWYHSGLINTKLRIFQLQLIELIFFKCCTWLVYINLVLNLVST
jgi:hypothetical protein